MVETGKPCLLGAYVDIQDDTPAAAEVVSSGQVIYHFMVHMLVLFWGQVSCS